MLVLWLKQQDSLKVLIRKIDTRQQCLNPIILILKIVVSMTISEGTRFVKLGRVKSVSWS